MHSTASRRQPGEHHERQHRNEKLCLLQVRRMPMRELPLLRMQEQGQLRLQITRDTEGAARLLPVSGYGPSNPFLKIGTSPYTANAQLSLVWFKSVDNKASTVGEPMSVASAGLIVCTEGLADSAG